MANRKASRTARQRRLNASQLRELAEYLVAENATLRQNVDALLQNQLALLVQKHAEAGAATAEHLRQLAALKRKSDPENERRADQIIAMREQTKPAKWIGIARHFGMSRHATMDAYKKRKKQLHALGQITDGEKRELVRVARDYLGETNVWVEQYERLCRLLADGRERGDAEVDQLWAELFDAHTSQER